MRIDLLSSNQNSNNPIQQSRINVLSDAQDSPTLIIESEHEIARLHWKNQPSSLGAIIPKQNTPDIGMDLGPHKFVQSKYKSATFL